MTSAIVSGLTVYQYQQVLHGILISNFFSSYTGGFGEFTYFLDKDAPLKLTDQEDTTVAITSLVAVFSIIEVPLAVCAAWSSDSLYQPPQENQISQVCEVFISHGGTRKKNVLCIPPRFWWLRNTHFSHPLFFHLRLNCLATLLGRVRRQARLFYLKTAWTAYNVDGISIIGSLFYLYFTV